MEGYFETIEGRGGGIVGSADRLFSDFLSLVVQKNFLFTFLPFQAFISFFAQSPQKYFSAFFWTAWSS